MLKPYLPGAISGALVTLIGVFAAFQLSAGDMDERELQKKIDEKASIIYVDKEILKSQQKNENDIKALKELYQTDILYIRGALERLLNEREQNNMIRR